MRTFLPDFDLATSHLSLPSRRVPIAPCISSMRRDSTLHIRDTRIHPLLVHLNLTLDDIPFVPNLSFHLFTLSPFHSHLAPFVPSTRVIFLSLGYTLSSFPLSLVCCIRDGTYHLQ